MSKFYSFRKTAPSVFCFLFIFVMIPLSAAQGAGKLQEVSNSHSSEIALVWASQAGKQVQIEAPVLFLGIGYQTDGVPLKLRSSETEEDSASFEYDAVFQVENREVSGVYRLDCSLSENDLLICETQLSFQQSVDQNFSVVQSFSVLDESAETFIQPERTGVVRTYNLEHAPGAYFDLGKGVLRRETQLAMPAIGFNFSDHSLAISTDPYMGVAFSAKSTQEEDRKTLKTKISLKTIYRGSVFPVTQEERTMALQFHQKGIDGMLSNFYQTIPDIEAGPDWIHDIQLTFYDYIAETGESFGPDLKALADRIPEAFRKNVLVCIHGYYDYLGRYSYNHETKSFDDEWDSYDNQARHLAMTKDELRRRMRLVKSYGFRVGIYYSDALAYDALNPDFREDWILKDANGKPEQWWYWQNRPDKNDKELNYVMDPSNPKVRQWFADYTKAYVTEFGKDLDALVWDETHCVKQGQLSKTEDGMISIDRAMMTLVAEVTREVQRGWDKIPDLALLLSDNINHAGRGHVPFCLVAHGTWQDSFCTPEAWAPGMIPNYRNCLYSCNWWPVGNRSWNRIAVERYGLPQGITNGYGDDMGPSEMPEDLLNETIELFLNRSKSGKDRTRYLLPSAKPHNER